ncbi:MAG TPA: polymer-forming cytoskeletal protein [Polyangiaceae bacterium]|nr:polymer-forming cytoskeletal protein [Polyangiaceae bacterium]
MAYASVIGSSTVIRGNVRGDSSLEILGRVEGDVSVTGDLELGPDAVVVGAVAGARIVIGGSVEGDVTGSEAVVISDTGRVVGDLSAPRVGMKEGAQLRGNVRTEGVGGVPASRAAAPRAVEARAAAPAAAERSASAGGNAAASAPRAISNVAPLSAPAALVKKQPPPPVIHAPRAGARARKRIAKR